MMQTGYVVKTGTPMFDALHAYGVGLVAATMTDQPVTVRDEGPMYTITYSDAVKISIGAALSRLLQLPTSEEIKAAMPEFVRSQQQDQDRPEQLEHAVSLGTLDGLLAALFTTPGTRVVSVKDLWQKQRLDPVIITKALEKATRAIVRWSKLFQRQVATDSVDALRRYSRPCAPIPIQRPNYNQIKLLMTLDPAWGYSTRSMVNDGDIHCKTGVTIAHLPGAPMFAIIGATRFLRAQRVAKDLVNLYVPLVSTMTLERTSVLPLLSSSTLSVDHALALYSLYHFRITGNVQAIWTSIAYQTLQTQSVAQSISIGRGCIDLRKLAHLDSVAPTIVAQWRWMLAQSRLPIDLDDLVACLIHRHLDIWLQHLRDVSFYLSNEQHPIIRFYRVRDVYEVTIMMHQGKNASLSTILERDSGTIRFGHALRQIGRYNAADLRDLVDQLECVHTQEQLLFALANIAQVCALARAKYKFTIIPTDHDLKEILDDAIQHGARTIAALLLILASLQYPASEAEAE